MRGDGHRRLEKAGVTFGKQGWNVAIGLWDWVWIVEKCLCQEGSSRVRLMSAVGRKDMAATSRKPKGGH